MGSKGPNGRITTIYGYNEQTGCNDMRGKNIIYLDRHPMKCNRWSNEFMTHFQLAQAKCTNNDMRYDYTCISPAQWEDCAFEGGTCNCNGVARFGTDPYWTKGKTPVNGQIACNTAVWGDPVFGKAKKCQCASNEKLGTQDCENQFSACQDFGNVVAVRVCLCVFVACLCVFVYANTHTWNLGHMCVCARLRVCMHTCV
jgi:hypothetical protein